MSVIEVTIITGPTGFNCFRCGERELSLAAVVILHLYANKGAITACFTCRLVLVSDDGAGGGDSGGVGQ